MSSSSSNDKVVVLQNPDGSLSYLGGDEDPSAGAGPPPGYPPPPAQPPPVQPSGGMTWQNRVTVASMPPPRMSEPMPPQVSCPSCRRLLQPPAGAPIFGCPCGARLAAPAPAPASGYLPPAAYTHPGLPPGGGFPGGGAAPGMDGHHPPPPPPAPGQRHVRCPRCHTLLSSECWGRVAASTLPTPLPRATPALVLQPRLFSPSAACAARRLQATASRCPWRRASGLRRCTT